MSRARKKSGPIQPGTKVGPRKREKKHAAKSTALATVLALEGCLAGVKEDLEVMLIEDRRLEQEREERKIRELQEP